MKPQIFIGSSNETRGIVEIIQAQLESIASILPWTTSSVFLLSEGTLNRITDSISDSKFGIFVLGPDDLLKIRSEELMAARDNVILELGISIGILGRERSFFLIPRNIIDDNGNKINFRLPTDLLGVTAGTYDHQEYLTNPYKALQPFSNDVINKITSINNKKLDLTGKWSERWLVYGSPTYKGWIEDKNAEIEQYGDKIYATFTVGNRVFKFNGIIQNMYITGLWDDVEKGATYHGAFQLKINIAGKTMQGFWLGFDTRMGFKSDIWEWKKEGEPQYPSELKFDGNPFTKSDLKKQAKKAKIISIKRNDDSDADFILIDNRWRRIEDEETWNFIIKEKSKFVKNYIDDEELSAMKLGPLLKLSDLKNNNI